MAVLFSDVVGRPQLRVAPYIFLMDMNIVDRGASMRVARTSICIFNAFYFDKLEKLSIMVFLAKYANAKEAAHFWTASFALVY
jgi:hypothetical protein